jgi:4-hydroxy-tetrahydrodipicolinate reductase
MKIALLGYGKMGKVIEKLAIERGHKIVFKSNSNTQKIDLSNVDIAIDFSTPKSAVHNISTCINNNTPVISGTTGWLEKYDQITNLCNEKKGAFIYSSNFSLGVNIFFELNKYLAQIMSNLKQYNVSLEEIHHTQKLDAPSGTAISLAEGIIENSEKTSWVTEKVGEHFEVPVYSKRINEVPGTHIIDYSSNVDSIKIEHIAHNRDGFALGAVIAAEWILNKKGVFGMKDVLSL